MDKKIDTKELKKIKDKGLGFIGEFKKFILRGNVMDMAVGVIIGSAFSGIVTALTDDFINPLINGIGGAEVAGEIKIYGGQVLKYGDFVTAVINFIIMAFVLFMLLKVFNKLATIGKHDDESSSTPPKKPDDIVLLEEIRDLLKKNSK